MLLNAFEWDGMWSVVNDQNLRQELSFLVCFTKIKYNIVP